MEPDHQKLATHVRDLAEALTRFASVMQAEPAIGHRLKVEAQNLAEASYLVATEVIGLRAVTDLGLDRVGDKSDG